MHVSIDHHPSLLHGCFLVSTPVPEEPLTHTCIIEIDIYLWFVHYISVDMIIGFRQRNQTIVESDNTIILHVHSLRSSEFDYEIVFRYLQNSSTASVESLNNYNYDAQFGNHNFLTGHLEESHILHGGSLGLRNPPQITINDDFFPEEDECITISIGSPEIEGQQNNFECNDDFINSTDFFCLHTICILNDDG